MQISLPESKDMKLGEILLACQLITEVELAKALKVQTQTGEHLGSVLLTLGYLKAEELQEPLGLQLGLPTVNLYNMEIDHTVINLLPFEKMKQHEALPIAASSKSIIVAMVQPHDYNAVKEIEFFIGRSVQPVVMAAIQINAALNIIEDLGGKLSEPLRGADIEAHVRKQHHLSDLTELKQLFKMLVDQKASDLLLSAGAPPCLKKDTDVVRISSTFLTPQDTLYYARELLSVTQREEFERMKELDFAHTYPDIGRFRINIYLQRSSISIAVRHINETIPTVAELGLPPWIEEYALKTQGLILITGPTGHGKTTTLAALLDLINRKRHCNIITIEDPIEYLHKHKCSNVNQREIGLDTDSFHEGLRHIFRQAPDVIVIGEMRDPESFAIAIQAAETGHLVLSTMHSNTSTSAIERIIDVFPPQQQQQIRVQLAESFVMILNQRLVPKINKTGVVLALEKLIGSVRSRNLIREGKTHQIRSMLQQSSEEYESIDIALARLVRENKISLETGLKFCENVVHFKQCAGTNK
ncbi:MAG: PilT/PilU family type 4a pilus ATPase [Geobacter sp.]|nr:MAG: PilT/PilU family type 4a pilus ATPase [Geobacter sp.]